MLDLFPLYEKQAKNSMVSSEEYRATSLPYSSIIMGKFLLLDNKRWSWEGSAPISIAFRQNEGGNTYMVNGNILELFCTIGRWK